MPAPHRFVLVASTSSQVVDRVSELLREAGISEPVQAAATESEAITALHHPDREPPLAVFVDVPHFPDPLRLIGWIVASPTTRLIPVFAIIGPSGPPAAEVEPYRPTAVISHPMDLNAVSRCISLAPLLRGSQRPNNPPTPPPPSGRKLLVLLAL
jgi:hypothetical protein